MIWLLLISLFSLCVLIYLSLFIIAYMVDEGMKRSKRLVCRQYARFFKQYGGSDYKENINADVLIMGNSRASNFIDPAILDKELSVCSYNLGLNGGSIELQYLVFDFYKRNNVQLPRIILMNMDVSSIGKNDTLLSRKNDLLVWCNDRHWKAFFLENPVFSLWEKYLPLWKYRDKGALIKSGLKEFLGISHSEYGKGILSYNDGYICLDDSVPMYKFNLSFEFTNDFSRVDLFLQQCIQHNIKVIFFYSPLNKKFRQSENNWAVALSLIEEYAKKNNILFLDYSQRPECNNADYFRDCYHLNKRGATWFSHAIACDLKKHYYN